MSMISALKKLETLLEKLAQDAKTLDNKNARGNNQSQFYNKAIFSDQLFTTRSDRYQHYVNEVTDKVAQFRQLINHNQHEIAENLLAQIEQQISALFTALNANQSRRKKIVATGKRKHPTRYKKAVESVMMPTHALYSKLAEHHEFERRLAMMITEREYQRSTANQQKSQQLGAEILALHQRLGRCRKAISAIEREIEIAEKRSSARFS